MNTAIESRPVMQPATPTRRDNESGLAIVLVLLLLVLATALGVSLLGTTDVDVMTSRVYADSWRATSVAETAVSEVIWRANLIHAASPVPVGSQVSANDLPATYDAFLDYDPKGLLRNGVDDDGDCDLPPPDCSPGLIDEPDELNHGGRNWKLYLVQTRSEPAPGPPEVAGEVFVEPTILPQVDWQPVTTADPTSPDVLSVRFKLESDTTVDDGDGVDEIVFYDPSLGEGGGPYPNTLSRLAGFGVDSPYNLDAAGRAASGSPVLLISVVSRVERGGRDRARQAFEVEAYRSFRPRVGKVLCGCSDLQIDGGRMTDSFDSSVCQYDQPGCPHNDSGDVGSNASLVLDGGADIQGSADANEDIICNGSGTQIRLDADAGENIQTCTVGGVAHDHVRPLPSPCECTELDHAALVDAARLANDNGNWTLSQPSVVKDGELKLTGGRYILLHGGTYYFDYVTMSGGDVRIGQAPDANGMPTLPPSEPVVVYVRYDWDQTGGDVNVNGVPAGNGFARNLTVIGTCDIKLNGHAFRGVVNTSGDVKIEGGAEMQGSMTGRNVHYGGSGHVTFDEDLLTVGTRPGPAHVIAWRELE